MPRLTVVTDVNQDVLDKLNSWFTRWNSTLNVPYADLDAYLRHVIDREIANAVKTTSVEIKTAYDSSDETTKAQIRALLGLS